MSKRILFILLGICLVFSSAYAWTYTLHEPDFELKESTNYYYWENVDPHTRHTAVGMDKRNGRIVWGYFGSGGTPHMVAQMIPGMLVRYNDVIYVVPFKNPNAGNIPISVLDNDHTLYVSAQNVQLTAYEATDLSNSFENEYTVFDFNSYNLTYDDTGNEKLFRIKVDIENDYISSFQKTGMVFVVVPTEDTLKVLLDQSEDTTAGTRIKFILNNLNIALGRLDFGDVYKSGATKRVEVRDLYIDGEIKKALIIGFLWENSQNWYIDPQLSTSPNTATYSSWFVVDRTPPDYASVGDNSTNPIETNTGIQIYTKWNDTSGVDRYKVWWNNTNDATMVNTSWYNLNNATTVWSNRTETILANDTFVWRICAQDIKQNEGCTGWNTVSAQDTTPPTMEHCRFNETDVDLDRNKSVRFHCKANDNDDIRALTLQLTYQNGSITNYTVTNTSQLWWNNTLPINFTSGYGVGNISMVFFVYDYSGNSVTNSTGADLRTGESNFSITSPAGNMTKVPINSTDAGAWHDIWLNSTVTINYHGTAMFTRSIFYKLNGVNNTGSRGTYMANGTQLSLSSSIADEPWINWTSETISNVTTNVTETVTEEMRFRIANCLFMEHTNDSEDNSTTMRNLYMEVYNFSAPSSVRVRPFMPMVNEWPVESRPVKDYAISYHLNVRICSDASNSTVCSGTLSSEWDYSFPDVYDKDFITIDTDANGDKDTVDFHRPNRVGVALLAENFAFIRTEEDSTSGECAATSGCGGGSTGPSGGGGGGGADDEEEEIVLEEKPEKLPCPFECCKSDSTYYDKACSMPMSKCDNILHKCVPIKTVSPSFTKILIGIVIFVLVYVVLIGFGKKGKGKKKKSRKKKKGIEEEIRGTALIQHYN